MVCTKCGSYSAQKGGLCGNCLQFPDKPDPAPVKEETAVQTESLAMLLPISSVWAEEPGLRVQIANRPDSPWLKVIQFVQEENGSLTVVAEATIVDWRCERLIYALGFKVERTPEG